MTNSTSSFLAIIFELAVFALIVAIGWRSVEKRAAIAVAGRPNGEETIIVAGEDDSVSSIVTTTESTQPASAPSPIRGRGEHWCRRHPAST